MQGGTDKSNGNLRSYITGADIISFRWRRVVKIAPDGAFGAANLFGNMDNVSALLVHLLFIKSPLCSAC